MNITGRTSISKRRHVPPQRGERRGRAPALRLAVAGAVLREAQHEGVPLPAAAPHRGAGRGALASCGTQVSTGSRRMRTL